jgi:hypothetical protein
MAVGDIVSDLQTITTGAYLDIQPAAGVEWVINNIYHDADVTIEFYNGTNSLVFSTEPSAASVSFVNFRCNNTRRIRVKNTNAASKLIGYDGIITK